MSLVRRVKSGMKYGYLFYRKPLLENKKERPMNLGDPIQSLATLRLLHEMGIPDEDILPIDRYDLADYDGEPVILLINGIESYEHYAYHTRFLPVSPQITPVFIGIHIHRELPEVELASFREHQPIGCRDEATVTFMKSQGIDAFLTGCLTMTFPKRKPFPEQRDVFLIDCPESTIPYIPDNLLQGAVHSSQVIRLKSSSQGDRLTVEETWGYIRQAQEQLDELRDRAALVVTSRLHLATPCAAMGIPVVMVNDTFDSRFQFIDRFLPLYTPDKYQSIDWNPKASILETVKETIIFAFHSMLHLAEARLQLNKTYAAYFQEAMFHTAEKLVTDNLIKQFDINEESIFSHAIWSVCMPSSYLLHEVIQERIPHSRMICAIDTWARGIYKDDIPIITPDEISAKLDYDTVILIVAPTAHEAAIKKLKGAPYSFFLVNGVSLTYYQSGQENLSN